MVQWWIILASPALLVLGLLSADIVHQGYLIFGRLDLLVLLSATLYLVLVPVFARTRRRAMATFVFLFTLIASLVAANVSARFWLPDPVVAAYPWPPMKRLRPIAPSIAGISSPARFSVNRFGLRGPEVPSLDGQPSLLCVGGSTTECLYVTDEKSWPWRLQSMLEQSLGRSVFVGNAGRSGHLARHHEFLLRHYPPVEAFDGIIVLAGINDLGCLLHSNRIERERRVPDETLFRQSRPHEAFYRRIKLWRLMESVLDVGTPVGSGQILQDPAGLWIEQRRASRREKRDKQPIESAPAGLDADLRIYRDALMGLVDAARTRGPKIVFLTQPTLWRADLSPAQEGLLVEQTETGAYSAGQLAELMDRYNDVLRDVAATEAIPLIDLARDLPRDESIFYDDCHFHEAGCEEVARRVADRLQTEFFAPSTDRP